jgi:hypothetical protein
MRRTGARGAFGGGVTCGNAFPDGGSGLTAGLTSADLFTFASWVRPTWMANGADGEGASAIFDASGAGVFCESTVGATRDGLTAV